MEERWTRLAGSLTVEELLQQAEGQDADQLVGVIQQLSDDLGPLERERSTLIETIAVERQERDRLDGTSRAAEANQDRERVLAEIRTNAQQYGRLRLAAAGLQGAMGRYRQ